MPAWPSRFNDTSWHDRVWKRAEMAAWDERWATLSPQARQVFTTDIKAAVRANSAPPRVNVTRLPGQAVEELERAGLVAIVPGAKADRFVIVPQAALGFAARVRALSRYRLLREGDDNSLDKYLQHAFDGYTLRQHLWEIAEKGLGGRMAFAMEDPVDLFVLRAAWPEWVADWLKSPLARAVLRVIEEAGGEMPITEVATRLPGEKAAEVRATLDQLVNYLALFEDLHLQTHHLQVGLLPAVREARQRKAGAPATLPAAVVPIAVAPEGGLEVPDLRAVLLEVASDPPRMKQGRDLFAKELPRFTVALPQLPEGLLDERNSLERRVDLMVDRAFRLNYVREVKQGKEVRLTLTEKGRHWLASSTEAQYEAFFAYFRQPAQDYYSGEGDRYFLGSDVSSIPVSNKKGDPFGAYYRRFSGDREPLRQAVYEAWARLPIGTFLRANEVVDYLSRLSPNPLLLGRPPEQVQVFVGYSLVPPLDELMEGAADRLFGDMVNNRLIAVGALQIGWSASREALIARLPRLDAYFGKAAAAPAAPTVPTRVVVQPDFSIMVIGPDAGPAAALAPFCERKQGQAGAAITFRLTRESVLRGLSLGLTLDEVVARLEKHASTPLPKNVRTEIHTWGGRIRQIKAEAVDLLRCPDKEAADRLIEALGKKAERLAETLVGLPPGSLSSAVRLKLRGAGLLVDKAE